jgi:hypothetical protein
MLIHGDLLSMPELREIDHVILDDRRLACARTLVGPRLVDADRGKPRVLTGTVNTPPGPRSVCIGASSNIKPGGVMFVSTGSDAVPAPGAAHWPSARASSCATHQPISVRLPIFARRTSKRAVAMRTPYASTPR